MSRTNFFRRTVLIVAIALAAVAMVLGGIVLFRAEAPLASPAEKPIGYIPATYEVEDGALTLTQYASGTADLPVGNYVVSNGADLKALATIVARQTVKDRVFFLNGDIQLTTADQTDRVAIGTLGEDFDFDGTFDGCGNTIDGLNGPSLFGSIAPTGKVLNLTIKNATIVATATHSAILVGGTNAGTIERVAIIDSEASLVVPYGYKIGGLVKHNSGTIKNSYVANLELDYDPDEVGALAMSVASGSSIESCFAIDVINSVPSEIEGLIVDGSSDTLTNCYYAVSAPTESWQVSLADAASGKLAVLLGEDVFGQVIGTATHPVFLLNSQLDTHRVFTVNVTLADETKVATTYCNNGKTFSAADFSATQTGDAEYVAYSLDLDGVSFTSGVNRNVDLVLRKYVEFRGHGTSNSPVLVGNREELSKLSYAFGEDNITISSNDSYLTPHEDYIFVKQDADISFDNEFKSDDALGTVIAVSYLETSYLYDYVNDAWFLASNTTAAITDTDLVANLNSEIDQWEPMDFYGEFNGSEKFINNLFVKSDAENVGFFGNFYGSLVSFCVFNGYVQGGTNVGGIIGHYNNYNNIVPSAEIELKVYQVTNFAIVVGTTNVGGIIGHCNNYNNMVPSVEIELEVSQAMNFAIVVGTTNVGGIVGSITDSTVVLFCFNAGTVDSLGANAKLGGLVGSTKDSNVTISGENHGNVTNSYEGGDMGGIVGYIDGSGTVTLSECINTASIEHHTGVGDPSLGGIIGQIAQTTATVNIIDCQNGDSGTDQGKVVSSRANAGGFIGKVKTGIVNITGGYNYGEVIATFSNAGGFVAVVDDAAEITIKNSFNHANITADYYVGGFIGRLVANAAKIEISNSENHGTIKALGANGTGVSDTSYVKLGGFIGYIGAESTSTVKIDTCKNIGDVTTINTRHSVGGFIGSADGTGVKTIEIKDSTNSGTISAGGDVGGFIGNISGDGAKTVTITGSTNSGNISAAYPNVGGFIGVVGGVSEKTVTITGSTNSGNITAAGNNVGGFIGAVDSDGEKTVTITGSTNSGNITAEGNNVGGFIGVVDSVSAKTVIISDSKNSGNITSAGVDLGGFIGNVNDDGLKTIEITNSENSGKVESTNTAKTYVNIGGFIGHLDDNSTSSITITGSKNLGEITSVKSSMGGIIGHVNGVSTIKITDSSNGDADDSTKGAIKSTVGNSIGGIIGDIYNDKTTVTMERVNNYGEIEAWRYVGGIFGYVYALQVKVSDSNNYGTVSATATTVGNNYTDLPQSSAGGIIGHIGAPTGAAVIVTEVVISGSTNSGNIKTAVSKAGGFIGFIWSTSATIEITGSTNLGNIESVRGSAGGFIGYSFTNKTIKIADCVNGAKDTNSGTISATSGSSIGGIIGDTGSATATITIERVDNYGSVEASNQYVGGFFGYTQLNGTIVNSNNYGAITAKAGDAGGFFGLFYCESARTFKITNSSNHGEIVTDVNHAGGFFGRIDGSGTKTFTLEGCENRGSIKATQYAGGFIGLKQNTPLTITDSENYGAVTATLDVGGFIGTNENTTVTIEDSENRGVVTATNTTGNTHAGGFIGVTKANTTIKNSVNYANINVGRRYAGGFIGNVDSTPTIEITGCTNLGNIISPAGSAGGLVGYISSSATINITNSDNGAEGDITKGVVSSSDASSGSSSGGIIGDTASAGAKITINGVNNYGIVTGAMNSIGGIIGYMNANLTMTDTNNYGAVSARGMRAGGLVGYFDGTAARTATITNSHNYGKVEAMSYNAGGIIGAIAGTGAKTITFNGCTNSGDVGSAALASTTTASGTGGFVGYIDDGGHTIKIENGNNSGNISGLANVGGFVGSNFATVTMTTIGNTGAIAATSIAVSTNSAGGIVGYNAASVTITSGSNAGTIEAGSHVGGFIGYNSGSAASATIKESENLATATITATENSAGGFVGRNTDGKITITDCTNRANVTTTMLNAGGIIGFVEGSSAMEISITKTHNYGEIKATTNGAGGIIGDMTSTGGKTITINDCTNHSSVSAANYAGGLVGNMAAHAAETLTIINCTNDGEVKASTNYAGGIIGNISGREAKTIEITNTVNIGNVEATGNNAGGFIGDVSDTGAKTIVISDSENYGDVKAGLGTASTHGVGGFISHISSDVHSATFANSNNKGNISSTINAGGFIGSNYGTVVISDCTNEGNISITSDGACVGGFIALHSGTAAAILIIGNSTNLGDVTATGKGDDASGFVAYALGSGPITIDGCINKGNINAGNTMASVWRGIAGGIIGDIYNLTNTVNINDVENHGTISAAKASGGIVGKAHATTTTIVNASNYGTVIATGDAAGSHSAQPPHAGGILGWIYFATDWIPTTNVYNSVNYGDVSIIPAYAGTLGSYAAGILGCNQTNGVFVGDNLVNFGTIANNWPQPNVAEIAAFPYSKTTITNSYGASGKDSVVGGELTENSNNNYSYTINADGEYVVEIDGQENKLVDLLNGATQQGTIRYNYWGVSTNNEFEILNDNATFVFWDGNTNVYHGIDGTIKFSDISLPEQPMKAYEVFVGWALPDGRTFDSNSSAAIEREGVYTAKYAPMFEGEGTKANPYLIQNLTDLNNLSLLVNAGLSREGVYYKQTADITVADFSFETINDMPYLVIVVNNTKYYMPMMSFGNFYKYSGGSLTELSGEEYLLCIDKMESMPLIAPIGEDDVVNGNSCAFSGNYDGDNHTISGLVYMQLYNAGLFGYVNNATIENVNIEKVLFSASLYNAGGIVGRANNSKITNCSANNVLVASTSSNRMGGIVGYAYDTTITGCSVSDLTLFNIEIECIGGIVGGAYDTTITDCSVSGLNLANTGTPNLGGIAGYVRDSSIVDCRVSDMRLANYAYAEYFGGIVGYADGVIISDCIVDGIYSTYTFIANFGGLVGWAESADIINSTVKNVTYDFEEELDTDSYSLRLGGMIGSSYYVTIVDSNVENIEVKLNVTGVRYINLYIGGIIGYAEMSTTKIIDNSVNGFSFIDLGESGIDSYRGVGGVLGCAYGQIIVIEGASIEDADMIMTLADSYAYASDMGGMVGGANESTIMIKNSYAVVGMQGAFRMGGLVGTADSCAVALENSYAILEVSRFSVDTYVGGLTSWVAESELFAENCFASLTFVGGIGDSQAGSLFCQLDFVKAVIKQNFAISNVNIDFCYDDMFRNDLSLCASVVADSTKVGGYAIADESAEALVVLLNQNALMHPSYSLWKVGENGALPTFGTPDVISFVDANGVELGAYAGSDGKVYFSANGDVYYTTDGSCPSLLSDKYDGNGIAVDINGTFINAVVLDSNGNALTKMLSGVFYDGQVVISFENTEIDGTVDSIVCGVGDIVELPTDVRSTSGAYLIGWSTDPLGKPLNSFFYAVIPNGGNQITLYPVWSDKAVCSVWDGTAANEDVTNVKLQEDSDASKYYSAGDLVYEINSAADFAGIAKIIREGSYTSLTNKLIVNINVDIDLGGYAWTPINWGRNNMLVFKGNGHSIYNLSVFEGEYYGGLFGFASNLIVDSLNIVGATVYGRDAAGALLGEGDGSVTVKNSTIQNAHIYGGKTAYIGGVMGSFFSGYMTLENNAVIGGTLNGGLFAGGMVGYSDGYYHSGELTFTNNYVLIDFISTATSGLLIGQVAYMDVYITRAYSMGSLDFIARSFCGDLVMNDETNLRLDENGYYAASMTGEYLIELMNLGARILGDEYMTWQMTASGLPIINYALAVGDIDDSVAFPDPDTFETDPAFAWYYENVDSDVYYISTAAEFAALSALSNDKGIDFAGKTIYLMADIDLTDFNIKPIGDGAENTFFRGTFEGNNHTISGVKNALFGTVETVATIQNLIVRGNILNSYSVSAIAAEAASAAIAISLRGTISQCESYVNITMNIGVSAVGGIAAVSEGGVIMDTYNYGFVKCNNQGIYLGGILGHSIHKTEISNCENNGNVYGYYVDYVGGIVGYAEINGSEPTATNTISGTNNYGNVTSESAISDSPYVGGIVGCAGTGTIVYDSDNYGKVHGEFDGYYMGGIYAYVGGIIGFAWEGITINYNDNYGEVSVDATTTYDLSVGGVVGFASDDIIIDHCNNYGDVSATDATMISIGGIVGYAGTGGTIKDSKNRDCNNISADRADTIYIGGIAGWIDSEEEYKIENCENRDSDDLGGVVSANHATTLYIGGIVGVANGKISIVDSFNSAALNGEDADKIFIGGIVGFAGYQNGFTQITTSGNYGDITARHAEYFTVGGIIGESVGAMMVQVTNSGDITVIVTSRNYSNGDEIRVGGLVGAAYGNGTMLSIIESSINYGDISVIDANESLYVKYGGIGGLVGTAKSLALCNSVNLGAISYEFEYTRLFVGGLIGSAEVSDESSFVVMFNSVNFGQVPGEAGAIIGDLVNNDAQSIEVNGCFDMISCFGLLTSGYFDEKFSTQSFAFVADSTAAGGYRILVGETMLESDSLMSFLNFNVATIRLPIRLGWTIEDGMLVPTMEIVGFDVTCDLTGLAVYDGNTGEDAATCLAPYQLYLTPENGYKYPSNIIVEVGGSVLSSDLYEWIARSGRLIIFVEGITGDIKITAVGELRDYTITASADIENGAIVVDSKDKFGATITVDYIADLGYELLMIEYSTNSGEWTQLAADENGNYSFILSGDTEIRATFQKIKYDLNVTIDGVVQESEKIEMGETKLFDINGQDQQYIKTLYYTYNGVTYYVYGGATIGSSYELTMPAADVDVVVEYAYTPFISTKTTITNESGSIAIPSNVGENTVGVIDSANDGETVAVRANIATGFELVEMVVTDANGVVIATITSEQGVFTMPRCYVEIELKVKIVEYTLRLDLTTFNWSDTDYNAEIFNKTYTYGQSITFTVNSAYAETYKVLLESANGGGLINQLLNINTNTFTMPAEDAIIRIIAVSSANKQFGVANIENGVIKVYNYTGGVVGAEIYEIDSSIAQILVVGFTTGYRITSFGVQSSGYPYTKETQSVSVNGVAGWGTVFTSEEIAVNSLILPMGDIGIVTLDGDVDYYTVTSGTDPATAVKSGDEVASALPVVITLQNRVGYNVKTVEIKVGTDTNWMSLSPNQDGTYSFPMPTYNATIRVIYEQIKYDVTVVVDPQGTGTMDVVTSAAAGETVTITTTPSDNYEVETIKYIAEGGGEITLAEGITSFVMPAADVTITVTFVQKSYDIDLAVSAEFANNVLLTKDENAVVGEDTGIVEANYQDIIYVLLSVGYRANITVTLDGSQTTVNVMQNSSGKTYFLMPAGAVAVNIEVERITYTLGSEITTGSGAITYYKKNSADAWEAVGSSTTAYYGDALRVVFEPSVGFSIRSWSGTTFGSEGADFAEFTVGTQNIIIQAEFAPISYNLTLASPTQYTISVSSATATYGSIVSVSATAEAGYTVSKLYYVFNGEEYNIDIINGSRAFRMPAGNVIVGARVEMIVYTLTFDVGSEGREIKPIDFTIKNNDITLYSASSGSAYIFRNWEVVVSTDANYPVGTTFYALDTLNGVLGNITLKANWAACDHTRDTGANVTRVQPTCTADGYTLHICSVCGGEYDFVTLPMIEHDYESVTTKPTCTEDGYTTHTCLHCLDVVVDTIVAATGHDYSIETVLVEATCTSKASVEAKCSHCDSIKTVVTDALGHDFDQDFTVDVHATCSTVGSQSKHCSRCNETTEVTQIPMLGHNYVLTRTVAPVVDTKTDGYDLYTCEHCGATEHRNLVEYETLIPPVLMTNVEGVSLDDYVIGTELPTPPAMEGYVFEGWYTAATYKGEALTRIDSLEADTVLYAKWAVAEPDSGVSGGGVVGIIIGCVLFTLISSFVVLYIVEKKKGPVMSKVFVKVDGLIEKISTKFKKKDSSNSTDDTDAD